MTDLHTRGAAPGLSDAFCARFGLRYPLLLSPMAGACTADMVCSVTASGGLGSFGAAGLSIQQLEALCADLKQRCPGPYNINLFSPDTESPLPDPHIPVDLAAVLRTMHDAAGLGDLPPPLPLFGPALDQLEVLLAAKVPVISFHFGISTDIVDKIRAAGSRVICTATSPEEARALSGAGVDAIIAQGEEAGGHRGTFLGGEMQPLRELIPAIAAATDLPVIAAGGLCHGRQIRQAIDAGAAAVQVGTAFLPCSDSPAASRWKHNLVNLQRDALTVTRAISGKPAQGIRTTFVEQLAPLEHSFLPYPWHYSLSRELRQAAVKQDDERYMVMWSGTGIDSIGAADLKLTIREKFRQLVTQAGWD
ncbi:MAG: nitronate monooxygenase [Pseudomonadales bacterium]|nr:nitronate monooxygenase [Pseudomonadales bacterium]